MSSASNVNAFSSDSRSKPSTDSSYVLSVDTSSPIDRCSLISKFGRQELLEKTDTGVVHKRWQREERLSVKNHTLK